MWWCAFRGPAGRMGGRVLRAYEISLLLDYGAFILTGSGESAKNLRGTEATQHRRGIGWCSGWRRRGNRQRSSLVPTSCWRVK